MKEVFFHFFKPSMQTIELLPESLEHLLYLKLNDDEPYSGKFRRLKSLRLKDTWFDFKFIKYYKIKVSVHKN